MCIEFGSGLVQRYFWRECVRGHELPDELQGTSMGRGTVYGMRDVFCDAPEPIRLNGPKFQLQALFNTWLMYPPFRAMTAGTGWVEYPDWDDLLQDAPAAVLNLLRWSDIRRPLDGAFGLSARLLCATCSRDAEIRADSRKTVDGHLMSPVTLAKDLRSNYFDTRALRWRPMQVLNCTIAIDPDSPSPSSRVVTVLCDSPLPAVGATLLGNSVRAPPIRGADEAEDVVDEFGGMDVCAYGTVQSVDEARRRFTMSARTLSLPDRTVSMQLMVHPEAGMVAVQLECARDRVHPSASSSRKTLLPNVICAYIFVDASDRHRVAMERVMRGELPGLEGLREMSFDYLCAAWSLDAVVRGGMWSDVQLQYRDAPFEWRSLTQDERAALWVLLTSGSIMLLEDASSRGERYGGSVRP